MPRQLRQEVLFMTVEEIQEALQAAGFDPGPVDGIRGRKTIMAIKEFQKA
jgi:peptidoglycan hydrolase-like protein with peptidoglycan-binding domain